MATPRDASDADLAARVAGGDHAAVDALWTRHGDAVHDHVVRWCQDAELAAAATAAAFSGLLEDLAAGDVTAAPLPHLLRTARSHVVQALRSGATTTAAVPRAVLVASADPAVTPDAAAAAWDAATALGTPGFSVLDLTARRQCGTAALSAVLALPSAGVQELVAAVEAQTDEATRAAYAGLATVPAPVAARSAVTATAVGLLGPPAALTGTVRLRVLAALTVAAVVVLGLGLAAAMRGETATPVAGPATAAAQPVPSPSPEPSPTPTPDPTPTLDTLDPPPEVPDTTPAPTPTPSPSPDPTPSETLAVTVAAPPAGAAFDATQDVEGQQVGAVPVAADLVGAGPDTVVAWTSSLAPGETLLAEPSGEVLLWLTEPCLDTSHVLTVTATDPADGESATASVDVQVRETCEEPLAITALTVAGAGGGPTVTTTPTEDGRHRVVLDVAAEATDGDLDWVWRAAGSLLEEPRGPTGTIEVVRDDCAGSFVVEVDVLRPGDDSTASAQATVQTVCPAADG